MGTLGRNSSSGAVDDCCGRDCSGAGSTRGATLTMYWSKLDMNLPVGDRCSVINLISWFEKNQNLGNETKSSVSILNRSPESSIGSQGCQVRSSFQAFFWLGEH